MPTRIIEKIGNWAVLICLISTSVCVVMCVIMFNRLSNYRSEDEQAIIVRNRIDTSVSILRKSIEENEHKTDSVADIAARLKIKDSILQAGLTENFKAIDGIKLKKNEAIIAVDNYTPADISNFLANRYR